VCALLIVSHAQVIRRNGRDRAQMEHEAVLYFQETPMKIKIPLLSGPDEVADVRRRTRIYYYYYYHHF
jgi:hypothetical protein